MTKYCASLVKIIQRCATWEMMYLEPRDIGLGLVTVNNASK